MAGVMDLVEAYVGREVDGHVCLGWSLGGHAAWQGWMKEERLYAVVVVVGCPDFMGEFCFSTMFTWMKGNEY
jgi:dienelactone hydrolase